MMNVGITQARRMMLWLMAAAGAALITYLAFRGYFSAELLLNFSNAFVC